MGEQDDEDDFGSFLRRLVAAIENLVFKRVLDWLPQGMAVGELITRAPRS